MNQVSLEVNSDLDALVHALLPELEQRCDERPAALFMLGTGVGLLPQRLEKLRRIPLSEMTGIGEPWCRAELIAGRLGNLPVWMIEDLADEPLIDPTQARKSGAWRAALPIWLAAASGATVLLHVSAGFHLPPTENNREHNTGSANANPSDGFLAVFSDHINVSGNNPLTGLGISEFGPLFPDLSRLHNKALRRAAFNVASRMGLELSESVVACTRGPAMTTPAERKSLGLLGAGVAVQGLATPLIAAGHAGMGALCICAVTDAAKHKGVQHLLEVSENLAAPLEDLVAELSNPIEEVAADLAEEQGR